MIINSNDPSLHKKNLYIPTSLCFLFTLWVFFEGCKMEFSISLLCILKLGLINNQDTLIINVFSVQLIYLNIRFIIDCGNMNPTFGFKLQATTSL